jgi:hypothetical protein
MPSLDPDTRLRRKRAAEWAFVAFLCAVLAALVMPDALKWSNPPRPHMVWGPIAYGVTALAALGLCAYALRLARTLVVIAIVAVTLLLTLSSAALVIGALTERWYA